MRNIYLDLVDSNCSVALAAMAVAWSTVSLAPPPDEMIVVCHDMEARLKLCHEEK